MSAVVDKTLSVTIINGGNAQKDIPIPAGLRLLEPGLAIPQSYDVIRIVNQKDGDKRLVWDSTNLNEIRDAKEMFDQLIAEGFVPYCVDPSGKKTPQIMTEFDPVAEEVIMSDDHRSSSALRPRREIVMTPQKMLAGG